MIQTTLPTDSDERKNLPVLSGALKYAPAAVMLMSETSKLGNDKHNPGQELHHSRGKSADHGDCIGRHVMDVEDIVAAFTRGVEQSPENLKQLRLELGQLMWRTGLYVQELAEKYLGAPLAPGAKLPSPAVEVPRSFHEYAGAAGGCQKPNGHTGFCYAPTGKLVEKPVQEPKPGTVTTVCGTISRLMGHTCELSAGHDGPHMDRYAYRWSSAT